MRIRARAIRRAGELLGEIEPKHTGRIRSSVLIWLLTGLQSRGWTMERGKLGQKAEQLVSQMQELADQGTEETPTMVGSVRASDEVVMNQLSKFAALLVILARMLDRAQKPIQYLTWVLAVLTLVIAIDAAIRIYHAVTAN